PTPPEAPVTRRTEPWAAGAGGSLHCVSACQEVRNTRGAAVACSNDQPEGMGARLAAATTTISARVPQTLTPASHRRMPALLPTLKPVTPGPIFTTSPT